jgi:transcription initiation factor TFIIF subunit beta
MVQSANHHQRTVDAKSKAKAQKERAARMEEHVLRDAIFACFARFRYWSMKSFKQELKQPEAWLREVLEKVAVLHKSGRFANHWEVHPEYRRENLQEQDSLAPDTGVEEADESESDGDDDENIKMEDVV